MYGLTIVVLGVVAIDLVTKTMAASSLSNPRSLGPATLRVTENAGVSFGLASGAPSMLLAATTTAVALAIAYYSVTREGLGFFPAGLIVGGALGNVGDRLADGAVTDFVEIGWWPVFNGADVFIVAGVASLLIVAFRRSEA